jgi:predicted CoA-binding protein
MAPDDRQLRDVLTRWRRIAVVGLSPKPERPSHGVAKYLQAHGYRIIPVNPGQSEILGERCYASLADVPEPVDIVDVFRRSEEVLPIAEQAIAIGAQCFWQQLGVVNEDAHRLVHAAGLVSVMDRCIKIEHARLIR